MIDPRDVIPDMMVFCLFGGGAALAALSGFLKRGRALTTLLAALCVVFGVLSGLTLGRQTLNELLTPLLIVCATAMAAVLFGKGGNEG